MTSIEAINEVILAVENSCTIANGREVVARLKATKEYLTPSSPYVVKEEWGVQAYCPCCDCYINQTIDINNCANCGQAIDWGTND